MLAAGTEAAREIPLRLRGLSQISHRAHSSGNSLCVNPLINDCIVGERRAISDRQRVVVELFCQSSLDHPQTGYELR